MTVSDYCLYDIQERYLQELRQYKGGSIAKEIIRVEDSLNILKKQILNEFLGKKVFYLSYTGIETGEIISFIGIESCPDLGKTFKFPKFRVRNIKTGKIDLYSYSAFDLTIID